jgi:diguanylate cyclase (GGDEF)-like protein
LLLVDLDNFKNINDALGHDHGDLVLQSVARRINSCVRERDTVARLGGDEFAVLLQQLSQDPLEAVKRSETVANKILEVLRQRYQIDGTEIDCNSSIGIALFGQQHENALEPLKRSELALYQAKAGGRNRLCIFRPQMQAAASARIALESALHTAINQRQFLLYYQPQLNHRGAVTGAEALIRWKHPRHGVVSPAAFIPLAEESGLIVPIGAWVLETACQQLAVWAGQPAMASLTLSVNVSARQFQQDDLAAEVLALLQRTGAPAKRLRIELTESLTVTNLDNTIAMMKALKAVGVGFSLDDFGTGYSSLAYLKRLPLDELKIDKSFVRDIPTDTDGAAIARMVIALGHSMGLSVIAEGVETDAQLEMLKAMGCHNYQGYLFSQALPIQELEAFVRRVANPTNEEHCFKQPRFLKYRTGTGAQG